MKKAILLFGIMFSSVVFGQFKLTPNNFVSEENPEKDYVVLEFTELKEKELFIKTKTFIFNNFKNLKNDGYNEIESSHIKLRARQDVSSTKVLGMVVGEYLTVTYEIDFKDGKIRIKPIYNEIEVEGNKSTKIYLTGGNALLKSIFKKDGSPWFPKKISASEKAINDFIKGLKESFDKKNEW